MPKKYRGRNIKKIGWRGICPLCKRRRVKLLWKSQGEEGKSVNICKICYKKV